MLYSLIKLYARFAIKIYCRKVIVNKPDILKMNGPLLLACNHPNSFLDGIILTTLFDHPLYSLARGDAFANRNINKLLRWLKLLPVYRTSEGAENLNYNYATFTSCQETFANNGNVLIFSEGGCENEWHLRPLKKGTARLAITAWKKNLPLTVIPVGINYSSFHSFGKEVHINFGRPVTSGDIAFNEPEGKQFLKFNQLLNQQLTTLVYEIDPNDRIKRKELFKKQQSVASYFLLLPAAAGWVLHAPVFFISLFITKAIFSRSVHYDAILVSLLYLSYPFYLAIILAIFFQYFHFWAVLSIVIMPLLAMSYVKIKNFRM